MPSLYIYPHPLDSVDHAHERRPLVRRLTHLARSPNVVLMKRTFQQPQGKTKFGEHVAGTEPKAPDLYLRSTSENTSPLIVPRVPTLDMTLEGPGRRLLTSPAAPPRLEATTVPRVATEAAGAAPAAGGGGSPEPKLEPLVRTWARLGQSVQVQFWQSN